LVSNSRTGKIFSIIFPRKTRFFSQTACFSFILSRKGGEFTIFDAILLFCEENSNVTAQINFVERYIIFTFVVGIKKFKKLLKNEDR
jgi:hypothetical protein